MLWALAVVGGLVVLAGVGLLVWTVPPALYDYVPDPKDRAGAESATRNGLIAGLAGLAALGSLAVTARTYRLIQQGHITDRYTKAIAQLGDDKLEVRLGGIYALERIAVDSKRDHPTIVEVLSAYVRERTAPVRLLRPAKPPGGTARSRRRPRIAHPLAVQKHAKLGVDVQAAVTVLGRLPRRARVSRGDLTGASLAGVNIAGADLAGAVLEWVDLTRADCRGAIMTGAVLTKANLTRARFTGANLTRAYLVGADLTRTFLRRANLRDADLVGASLTKAWLRSADLTGTLLGGANLTGASFCRARLAGTDFLDANLADAELVDADLTEATGLTQEQLDVATGDSRTTLGAGLQRPDTWPSACATAPMRKAARVKDAWRLRASVAPRLAQA